MKHEGITIAIIIFIGFLLRFYLLGSLPASLNQDEASLGYNAYSFLKTGADEHGKFFPLALESFGDWKLPTYSYIDMLPVAVLGLTELSVRLPSAIAGVFGIWVIYALANILFRKKSVSILAALFYALSPWNIYFSRAAYEVNLATTLFLAGVLLFLVSFEAKRKKLVLAGSAIFFGLTLFTYHSFIIFTPLFVLFLSILYRKKMNVDRAFGFFAGISLFLFALSIFTNISQGANKFNTTTIFNNRNVIYNRVEVFRGDGADENLVFKKLHTRFLGVPYQIAQNYLSSFSPAFLFDKGGEKLLHNLNGFGNLYLFDALLLFAGFAGLFYFREKSIALCLGWLLLSPIPCALTLDAPNSTRLFMLMPLFALISGYGGSVLWELFSAGLLRIIRLGLIFLFLLNVIFFLDNYFIHFTAERVRFWHYGSREVIAITNKNPQLQVVMLGPENFPYIYFLFYNAYDPEKFRREVVYYPRTDEGFLYVKSFGRYSFVKDIDYGKTLPEVLYITDRVSNDAPNLIRLPNGDPWISYTIGKK